MSPLHLLYVIVLVLSSKFHVVAFSSQRAMYLMCHPKQVPFPGSSIHFITSSLELFNQKTSCGCQHPTTFVRIAHQNYIASKLEHLLLQAMFLFHISLKSKTGTFSQELPHLSITKSIHSPDLHVLSSPSFLQPQ